MNIALGCDIVDLHEADYLCSERWLNRAFTLAEKKNLHQSHWQTMAARIWSCKEAAYKTFSGLGFREGFSPRLFDVVLHDETTSKVYHQNYVFDCLSHICNDFVFSTSLPENAKLEVVTAVYSNDETAEKKLLATLKKNNGGVTQSLGRTGDGLPFLLSDDNTINTKISLSHDGRFYAACWLTQNRPNEK